MSLNLEQTDGTEGTDGEAPPQPCKPKDASSATAVADPSFSSSRRVTLCINPKLLMRFPEQRSDRVRGFEREDHLQALLRSALSFALASAVVSHSILLMSSAPPQASAFL